MKANKFFGCMLGIWVGSALLSFGVAVAIIYAAIHFIAKYW